MTYRTDQPAPHRNITFRRLVLDALQFIRVQKPAVHLLGRPFAPSRRYVEIDITYRCNLRCANCNRSCTQAPARVDLPVHRIGSFIEESIARDFRWERIRLLGGEPTLHPAFENIVKLLVAYKRDHLSGMRIVVCTNGAGRKVRRKLSRLPEEVHIKCTAKNNRRLLFRPFNMAPVDSIAFRFADFTAGCRILQDCGLGLTPTGCYPCAVAGGIDRIFGFGLGRRRLPLPQDDMKDLLEVFCRYCGHFGFLWPTRRQKTSPTWKAAYHRYSTVSSVRLHRPAAAERFPPVDLEPATSMESQAAATPPLSLKRAAI